MKTTFKIIFAVLIGAFIGYSIADYSFSSDEVEIVNEDKVENIIELMGTETSFGVKGNCKMCKKTIETSALSLDGVHKAVWDVKTKQIDLVYDDQLVELTTIHNTIASSGYSTDLVDLNQEAYDNLPMCCQYDPEN
ncbi:MAG: heavy-metal-associated domain-containing protein [Flavobacteriaceae bacterium]|mgnify:FL=1|nr:heavy-metal-associated domain-containing protein [Flavobacteriaceae bacterium]